MRGLLVALDVPSRLARAEVVSVRLIVALDLPPVLARVEAEPERAA